MVWYTHAKVTLLPLVSQLLYNIFPLIVGETHGLLLVHRAEKVKEITRCN